VPIIALTANAISGSDEMFLQNGFDGFIPKPIDIFQLDAALNTWVRDKQNAPASWGTEDAEKHMPPQDGGIPPGAGIDGLDLEAGTARYESETAYLSILKSYVLHTPPLLAKLSALGNLESPSGVQMRDYATTVHGLKGASYGICADPLAKRAEALELAAKSGEWEMVRSGNDALIGAANALLEQLRELMEEVARQTSEKREKEVLAEPDRELLKKMLSAARHFRTSQMEDLLAELENFDYQSGAELVSWLREQTDDIEYDAVAQRLETLLN
jgi:CheY-like chemotaxis protein